MDFNLIPKVQAQSTFDASAQPTFGTLNLAVSGGDGNAIRLELKTETGSPTVAIGDTIKVEVGVFTGVDISISDFRLAISYDPQMLTVLDQDSVNDGTQSEFTGGVFSIQAPIEDNNFVSTGDGDTSSVIATAVTTFEKFTINKDGVLVIEFQAQQLGNTEISIDTDPQAGTTFSYEATRFGYNESSLTLTINESGDATNCTTTSDCPSGQECLTSGVCGVPDADECSVDDDCGSDEVCISGSCIEDTSCSTNDECVNGFICAQGNCVQCVTTEDCSGGLVCESFVCVAAEDSAPLPATALFDSFGSVITFAFAIGLIGFGLFLKRSANART